MIVDIHAHYFPKEYNALLLRIGGKSLPEAARAITARRMRDDDLSGIPTRLEQMDEAGVSMQVLSPAASPPYAEKEDDAVAAARLLNDSYADLARRHPGRVQTPGPNVACCSARPPGAVDVETGDTGSVTGAAVPAGGHLRGRRVSRGKAAPVRRGSPCWDASGPAGYAHL